jgi:hypothetical protein
LSSFAPKLNALPPAQLSLWPQLREVPSNFVLYGGTGLALRLGHRASVDFDFFSPDPLDRRALERLAFVRGAQVLQDEPDALTVSAGPGDPVKISFFGPVGFGRVGTPEKAAEVVRVASLLDLGATKVKALLQRVEAKDYLDMAALVRAGVGLSDILRAARCLFGEAFNPLVARKALSWFQGGDFSALDAATRELLAAESMRDVELPAMLKSAERLD